MICDHLVLGNHVVSLQQQGDQPGSRPNSASKGFSWASWTLPKRDKAKKDPSTTVDGGQMHPPPPPPPPLPSIANPEPGISFSSSDTSSSSTSPSPGAQIKVGTQT